MVPLTEAYVRVKRLTGVLPSHPKAFRKYYLGSKRNWDIYVNALSEGLDPKTRREFKVLAEQTGVGLLENAAASINPYETLTVPVLRRFYPRLIARELVHTTPIDKPEVIRAFVRAYFGTHTDVAAGAYPYQFPYIPPSNRHTAITNFNPSGGEVTNATANWPDISRGIAAGGVQAAIKLPSGSTNVLTDTTNGLGLEEGVAHLERDFTITGVYFTIDGTEGDPVDILPKRADVDGNFSFDVSTTVNNTVYTDTIVGRVNYYTGVVDWKSINGNVTSIDVVAVASLEENRINPMVRYTIEKIRLVAQTRQIGAEWTIPFEQDIKALYDLDIQAELVNLIGEQIAIDIDREIIDDLIRQCMITNGTSHYDEWEYNVPSTFAWGQKMWMETILPKITKLSARVYNDTLIGAANIIACNPVDAAIFENLNDFRYTGSSSEGGDLGYQTATIQGGKYKILVSSVVPEGKMILALKEQEEQKACYFYAPYRVMLLTPYPLGPKPAMTVMSRYAIKMVRPEGVAILRVVRTS